MNSQQELQNSLPNAPGVDMTQGAAAGRMPGVDVIGGADAMPTHGQDMTEGASSGRMPGVAAG